MPIPEYRRTKTFNLYSPSDLYRKLLFDIDRLRSATSTKPSVYAALDCAIASWHLVDWVLQTVTPEHYKRLCGLEHPSIAPKKPREKRPNPTRSFVVKQMGRLPKLDHCQQIANAVKHRELDPDWIPELATGSTGIIEWHITPDGGRSESTVRILTYITLNGSRYPAISLFEEAAAQWLTFLKEENLFDFRPTDDDA